MSDIKIEDNPKILSGPVLTNSPNAVLSKTLLNRYNDLPIPADKILATYIWIDGTGESVRCKDRTINYIPKQPKVDKLTHLLDTINRRMLIRAKQNIKWSEMNCYLPPMFWPKDLDSVFEARCKLGDTPNRESFDENVKGFTPISPSAVIQMLNVVLSVV